LCLLVAFVVSGGCSRKGHDKAAKRTAVSTKTDTASQTHAQHPNPLAPPPLLTLPELAPPPGKQARRGGTLRVHLEAEPPHLNPLLDTVQVIDRVVTGLVYETLIECRGGGYQPGLADTWEVSADGLRILLHLRTGTRWHDDKPFTALDVQATLEHLLRSPNRSGLLHTMVADIEGVDIMPERMVRLRLFRPSDLTLRALCEVPMLPAEPLRTGGQRLSQLGRSPIGTGPYRVTGWDRGKRIKLARARESTGMDAPTVDEIVFEIDTDPARALTRLRRGEIDILPRVSEVHYPEQVSLATLRDVLSLFMLRPDRYTFVSLNTKRGVLADATFRHALSLLWDRKRFASEFHHGLARPIGAPTFGSVPADPFDREKAKRLFDQAGFVDTDGDGVREIGGAAIRMTFLIPSGSHTLASEVHAFALDLRRVGILLDHQTIDAGTMFSRVERGDYDMAALTWDGRKDEDPRVLLGTQGEYGYTGYRSDRFSATVDMLKAATSPAARAPILQQLAEVLAGDRPALFLYRHDVPLLMSRRVHGLAAIGDRLDFRSIWMDP
jgi:peptide/nickel transport system substrate-binding protein